VKISELIHSPVNTPEANLITALELIRNRYKDKDKLPSISTQSLINLVLNTDKTFDYDALVQAAEANPAVKNLIKSYNKDQITLRHDEPSEVTTTISPEEGDLTTNPVDTVDDMAKRAAKQRGAPISNLN
jgi:hypothetical protein